MQTITFPNISTFSNVRHAVFTRQGGCSQGPYQSLNVSHGIGDPEKAVENNRHRLAHYMDAQALALADQMHGTNILVIKAIPASTKNPFFFAAGTGDALITHVPNLYLVIQTADCQPVMIVDIHKNVIANVHVGWRGNVQNILGLTIKKMQAIYGCQPSDLQVAIGPSLGPCCAEFINYRHEFPRAMWPYQDDRHRFDLWNISSDQLRAAGVAKANLHINGICTKCRTDLFYSYRAQSVTGRFASVIGICL
jgi:YfiH family protein